MVKEIDTFFFLEKSFLCIIKHEKYLKNVDIECFKFYVFVSTIWYIKNLACLLNKYYFYMKYSP